MPGEERRENDRPSQEPDDTAPAASERQSGQASDERHGPQRLQRASPSSGRQA